MRLLSTFGLTRFSVFLTRNTPASVLSLVSVFLSSKSTGIRTRRAKTHLLRFQNDCRERNKERKVAPGEPTLWQLYQKRWKSWVEQLDVQPQLRDEILKAGFQGAIGSTDGTYGRSSRNMSQSFLLSAWTFL